MSQPLLSRAAWLATAVLLASGPGALAQTAPAASSWIEAGGAYHRVTNHFGDWKGGYVRAVLAGTRNTWYVDAKTQEAFRDAGSYGSVANVHTWSSRVYTQIGAGAGTGRYVLPDLRLDAAVSFKLGASRAVVVTAGGTVVKSKSVYQDKALFGSLTWYLAPAVVAEVGGRLNWSNPNAVRSERVNATLSHGRAGHALVTLRGSVGTEGYQLTGAGTTLRRFRSQEAGLIIRKWLGHSWGGVLGTEWYHNPFYARTGGSAGVFYAW
jgi:YaiO family outer membrane protein